MSEMFDWLEEKLKALNLTDTMDRPEGFTRLSFSPEEKASHAQFRKIAEELGLAVSEDEAGNQWAVWEVDKEAPTIALGSHVDTVVNGGGYDGVAGVLSALAAVKALKDKGYQPAKNIAIICFISEESARFGVSTIGSKALTGQLEKDEIGEVTDSDGITVREAVSEYGLNWSKIEEAELSAEKLESFMELHIEQGTQIVENRAEIGIVNGVACPVRLKVRAKGMANHTGSTPMHNRKDAFVAIAPLVNFVSDEAARLNRIHKSPLVATVSTIELKPNVMNVIPGEIELGIDIRSVDDQLKRDFASKIKVYCDRIEQEIQVMIDITTLVDNDSVLLDSVIQQKLSSVCDELGYDTFHMDSGAGHDVMNMAARWPSGLLFIPCKEGISHHPKEFASMRDISKGIQVIQRFFEIETEL
ncbi:M20 family metallo-hydrolase [Virgibacillus kekensis]|uniref:M20 family metallo-hydrolase n=1 Tax=Virgibacillus kekensis TaxID=202261 RepID=A0ABV9DIT8_9BACI